MATKNQNILALVAQVAALRGNRFASLTYTSKDSGEVARHTLQLGFSYGNCVEKSREMLLALNFNDYNAIESHKLNGALFNEAKAQLLASFDKTLAAHAVGERNADYTKKDVYLPLFNGLNVSQNDGSFKLFGLSVAKTVLQNGVFREVKSAPLTVAKNKIRRLLPVGKFREFAIDENTLAQAKLNGETIEI